MSLSSRAALKRQFYRLVDSEADDEALTRHDASTDEAVNEYVQTGIDRAQEWMLREGKRHRWVSTFEVTADEMVDVTGDGRIIGICVPDDFFRLAGDKLDSAVLQDGKPWGGLVEANEGQYLTGDHYFLGGDNFLCFCTTIPAGGLEARYIYRLARFESDNSTFDLDEAEAALAAAYAAQEFADTPAYLFGAEGREALAAKVKRAEQRCGRLANQTQAPQRMQPPPTRGTHYFV
jgi:hypothetical protein